MQKGNARLEGTSLMPCLRGGGQNGLPRRRPSVVGRILWPKEGSAWHSAVLVPRKAPSASGVQGEAAGGVKEGGERSPGHAGLPGDRPRDVKASREGGRRAEPAVP